jgi:GNAT superfamily N-acetyltransferase
MIWAVQPDRAIITRNLRLAMSTYSRSTEHGATLDLGAAGAFCSGVDYAVFNALVVSESVSSVRFRRILDDGEAFFRQQGVSWSCWLDEAMVDPANGAEAARILESRGMRWIAEHEGMLTSRIRANRRKPPQIDPRPVLDDASREDFIQVCSKVFLLPESITRRIYGSPSFWSGVMRGWVGYDGGQPACIAVSAADEGSVGLYSIGTMPGYRRRGFGEFITRYALSEATGRSGLKRWSLQSTPAGIRLYSRMGYEARTRINVWASK